MLVRVAGSQSAGRPSATSGASLVIGRPSTDVEDQVVALGDGKLDATIPIELAPGVWRITIKSAEPSYQFSDTVFIPENR